MIEQISNNWQNLFLKSLKSSVHVTSCILNTCVRVGCPCWYKNQRFPRLIRSTECSRTSGASIGRFVSSSIPHHDLCWRVLHYFSLSSPVRRALARCLSLFLSLSRVWSSSPNVSRLSQWQSAVSSHRFLFSDSFFFRNSPNVSEILDYTFKITGQLVREIDFFAAGWPTRIKIYLEDPASPWSKHVIDQDERGERGASRRYNIPPTTRVAAN